MRTLRIGVLALGTATAAVAGAADRVPTPDLTATLPDGLVDGSQRDTTSYRYDGTSIERRFETSIGRRIAIGAGLAPGPTLIQPTGSATLRVRLTTSSRLTTTVAARWVGAGLEGPSSIEVEGTAQTRLRRLVVLARAVYATEPGTGQRDAEVAAAALHPVAGPLALGVGGTLARDLDGGRTDGIDDVLWAGRGGALANVTLRGAQLAVEGGYQSTETRATGRRAGPYTLAVVGGRF